MRGDLPSPVRREGAGRSHPRSSPISLPEAPGAQLLHRTPRGNCGHRPEEPSGLCDGGNHENLRLTHTARQIRSVSRAIISPTWHSICLYLVSMKFLDRTIVRGNVSGFSLVEVMVAAAVLAIGLGGIVAVNSQAVNTLRRGSTASFASQLIQERMEQFRRGSWTEITSNYPPADPDPGSAGYDDDTDGDPYVDEFYPTDFPYSASELDSLTPGMLTLLAVPTASATQLPNAIETVKVEVYNAADTSWTGFDWNGDPLTLTPYTAGGRPIIVSREGGVVTQVSHNAVVVFATTARLTFTVTWKGSDGKTRTKETVTLFTVEGDK